MATHYVQGRGDFYDTMQVCVKNGHKITEFYDTQPKYRQDHCGKCGSRTTTKCEKCAANIRGYYHMEGVIGGPSATIPTNCVYCGESFKWKNRHRAKNLCMTLIAPMKYIIDTVAGVFKK